MSTVLLELLSTEGRKPRRPTKCRFGKEGGRIGRAPNNEFALGPEDKLVSRVHARVAWRKESAVIVSCGANALRVDGRKLKRGEEVPIRNGMILKIGSHEILATLSSNEDPEKTVYANGDDTTIRHDPNSSQVDQQKE